MMLHRGVLSAKPKVHAIEQVGSEGLRSTLLHVLQCVFCHGKHLQDVAAERALDDVQVDVGKVTVQDLLRSVVDKHIEFAKLLDVFVYSLLTRLIVHQIPWNQQALPAFLLYAPPGLFRVNLLLGQVDDADIGTFTGEEYGH